MTELTDHQLERYARNVILDEVGEDGQLKLLSSKVLVIGAGGLGAPLLLYLAAAGIGTVGTAILGIYLFGESAAALRLVCIGLIVAGIVGLKVVTPV